MSPRESYPPQQVIDRREKEIRRRMEQNLAYYSAHHDEIDERLRELDQEPTVESVLLGAGSAATITGVCLSFLRGRLWLLVPVVAQYFAIEHLRRGTCTPMRLLRALGVRTRAEVEEERYALKLIRGDFQELPEVSGEERFEAARRLTEAVQHQGA